MPLKMIPNKPQKPLSSIKNILAIAAGKGGVGKSTVTANLALALQKRGYQVGILDTDIYGPSLRKILPEDKLPSQQGDVLSPAIALGMPILSMAYFRREDEASAVRAPIANSIIQQFINNTYWGELDYLLIDFPPGTGDIQLTLCQQAHLKGAVMVTTPQDLAVMDVQKAMHLFEQVNVPIVGIVENMSYINIPSSNKKLHPFGEGGGRRLSRESGVPFLGQIPLDSNICHCCDNGKSLFNQEQEDESLVKSFFDIAENVINQVDLIEQQSKNSLTSFNLVWKDMSL